jgi:hypothetical protein
MAVAYVLPPKWTVSQGYAQVVNCGWKLKCMYWRGRRFDLLTSDGLVGAIYEYVRAWGGTVV